MNRGKMIRFLGLGRSRFHCGVMTVTCGGTRAAGKRLRRELHHCSINNTLLDFTLDMRRGENGKVSRLGAFSLSSWCDDGFMRRNWSSGETPLE